MYPVNPSAKSILGLDCLPDAAAVPEGTDLVAVLLPADKVPGVLETLAKRGVKAAMVPAAGFAETGEGGRQLQDEIQRICATYKMRVLGPNVPGFINADAGLIAAFAGGPLGRGPLAIVSQAGSIGYTLVRNSLGLGIDFGRVICIGNQVDIADAEVIEMLREDPSIRAICLYIEGVKDGRKFLEVAARTTPAKPIVALKGGQTAVGHKAIFSHTASVSSPERLYRAAFRRAGIVGVESLRALGTTALALAHQTPARGDRVAIVTSLAGQGVIAADACVKAKLSVAESSPGLREKLRPLLPPIASARNPIDLTGDVNPDMLARCIRTLGDADEVDAILPLVMGVPGSKEFGNIAYMQAMKPALEDALARSKVVAIAWVMDEAGGEEIKAVRLALHGIGVPVCDMPEDAVDVLRGLIEYGRLQRSPERTAVAGAKLGSDSWTRAVRAARERGDLVLAEHDCKALLEEAGLPVVPSRLAKDAKEAAAMARAIRFPVALKLQSPDITHKSDVGGVVLGLESEASVERAFADIVARFRAAQPEGRLAGVSVQPMARSKGVELMCGVSEDAQFGKYLAVGLGGVAVEVLGDVSIRLLPVNDAIVAEMLDELKGARLLDGYRGAPKPDRKRLIETIVRMSRLAEEPSVLDLEINPLLATAEGAVALDARMRLRPASPTNK